MNAQPSLWEAEMARDAALERVEEHADPEWMAQALVAVYRTAERLPDFISDDVWRTGLEQTREDRALGPVFRKAARLGWIRKTNLTRPSARSHGSGKPVWLSMLWSQP